jgi:hypothetical protein
MSKECTLCRGKIGMLDASHYLDSNKDYIICQHCLDMELDCKTLIKESPDKYLIKRDNLLARSANALPKAKDLLLKKFRLWEETYLHLDYTIKDGKIIDNVSEIEEMRSEGHDNTPVTRSDFERLFTELSAIKENTSAIKNCVVFFTVLTVIGLVFYILIALANR